MIPNRFKCVKEKIANMAGDLWRIQAVSELLKRCYCIRIRSVTKHEETMKKLIALWVLTFYIVSSVGVCLVESTCLTRGQTDFSLFVESHVKSCCVPQMTVNQASPSPCCATSAHDKNPQSSACHPFTDVNFTDHLCCEINVTYVILDSDVLTPPPSSGVSPEAEMAVLASKINPATPADVFYSQTSTNFQPAYNLPLII